MVCACDGNFYRDKDGKPHGTGQEDGHYSNGKLRTRIYFKDGKEVKEEWYDRDGKSMMSTIFDENVSGPGIVLDDRGIVRIRGTVKKGLFDGPAELFDEEGRFDKKVLYNNGVRVTE